MRVLFYFSHPAQFHFSKYAIEELLKNGFYIDILVKTKDVLTNLLDEKGWEYTNIQKNERLNSRFGIVWGLILRDIRVLRYCIGKKYSLLIGTDASLAHVGFLLKIPVLTILEDDYNVIKNLARLTFPFTSFILTPNVCNVGKWDRKKIGYNGYMKLAYLHPKRFKEQSNPSIVSNKPFFLIRLSGLSAHHDFGMSGISDHHLDQIINKLEGRGIIFISAEKEIPAKYSKYLLNIQASNFHSLLSNCDLLICDSQSLAVEAAMLGIPNVRISSFSGKISVLEELEHKYHLTFGYKPEHSEQSLLKIDQLMNMKNLLQEFKRRKEKMLEDKIDVTGFLVWFIEYFPESIKLYKKNNQYQMGLKENDDGENTPVYYGVNYSP